MRHASSIITITQTMKDEIIARSNTKSDIYLIDNPAISFDGSVQLKTKGFVFSGNLGRLQRISLLLKSIDKYKKICNYIDISGGIESSGVKDISKIDIFLNRVKKVNDEN